MGGAAYCKNDFGNYVSALFGETSLVTSVILVSVCFMSGLFAKPESCFSIFDQNFVVKRNGEENFAFYQLLHIF